MIAFKKLLNVLNITPKTDGIDQTIFSNCIYSFGSINFLRDEVLRTLAFK